MSSSLKKQKHPGASAHDDCESIPDRPGTATPKKTDWHDGHADSGFGVPKNRRQYDPREPKPKGAYPTGHTTLQAKFEIYKHHRE